LRIPGRLKTELVRRGTHPEVLRYCEEELVRRLIFYAVFEAAKGLAARLRQLGGSTLDGSKLVDYCFEVLCNGPGAARLMGYRRRQPSCRAVSASGQRRSLSP
jgi:hypothetical protein